MTIERPALRIIDPRLWQDSQARLKAIRNRYTGGGEPRGATRHPTRYLFSGILICGSCDGPMTISGGSSCRYYSCATNRTKGACANRRAIKEPIVRTRILSAIRERLTCAEGIAHVRKGVAEYLRDYSKNQEAEIKERQERIQRTEGQIRGLIDFIAQGDRSQYVVETLGDLEKYVLAEKATVGTLIEESRQPLRSSRH